MKKTIKTFLIDFDNLEDYRIPNSDEIPVCSLLHIYQYCGISDYITEHPEYRGKSPLDFLAVNFYTMQRLRNYIRNNWETFNITIEQDGDVKWKEYEQRKRRKHPKQLPVRISNSVNADFLNYSPDLDDDLEDNIIAIEIEVPDEEEILEAEISAE